MARIRSSRPTIAQPRIAFVAECATDDDVQLGLPLLGKAGDEFGKMLKESGIVRHECFLTAVLMEPVPKGNPENICVNKTEANALWAAAGFPGKYDVPPLKQGKYIPPSYLHEVVRLKEELEAVKPNVVVAMGPLAAWALLGSGSVKRVRGTAAESILVPGLKVLPSYGPTHVIRQWDLRSICILDYIKAREESAFPQIVRPSCKIWVDPTIADLWEFKERFIHDDSVLSTDIETAHRQATCIGFAPSRSEALVIPFFDQRKPDHNYWKSLEEELEAWRFIQHLLEGPWKKLFQNGLYDIQYLYSVHKMRLRNCEEDTMLLHHSLQPELEKGLGFLGSIYTSHPSWKLMARKRPDTEKRDE